MFSAARDMYVYFEVYEGYGTAMQPLVACGTFYRDGVKAVETHPIAVTGPIARTSRAIPVRMSIRCAICLPAGTTGR